jgi:DNA repair exonuclease SbcCD ATPase subunit
MLEQKVKQAAQSLYRLENAANKGQRSGTSVNANSHLDIAQKKCDEISAELWRLQSLEMDIERKLLNHNAAVLGLGMNIMERKAMEGGMTDEFGEEHLYIGHEDEENQPPRFSLSGSRSRSISDNVAQLVDGNISNAPTAEVVEAQTRLRQLNFHIATIARTDISPSSDNLTSYIDQLEQNFQALTDSHTTITRDLQKSLSESQRVIETLKLRERDQSAAITDHTSRIEDLERKLLQTQKEFDRVQNELDDQDTLVDNLKQELDTAREEARIAETAAMGREAESLRREKSLRRGETERFTNDIVQKDKSITDLSSQLNGIRQQHDSQQQQSRDLQSKLDDQARQHDVAIRELETQLVMLKSETAMLKAEKDEILGSRQQRAEEARKQRELDQQREKYRTSVADEPLKQELETLKKRNSQLTRDLQYSESERHSTEESLSRQIEVLEKQIASHTDTVVVAMDKTGGQSTGAREKILEARCVELQDELSSILDDFERLTSQFIDHESFRQSLESQIDTLRGQCHLLQTELAEEKVRYLGRDVSSPVQGGFATEQTSTGTLRTEFRKMVAEMRNEHTAVLKVCVPPLRIMADFCRSSMRRDGSWRELLGR